MEVEDRGVSVTVVSPGFVATEFIERSLDPTRRLGGMEYPPIDLRRAMTADRCAGIILRAAHKQKRRVVMQPGPIGLWLKLLAPKMMDRLTVAKLIGSR